MSDFQYTYKPCNALFTPTEIDFMKVLENLTGDHFKIFGKVRIADILNPAVNKYEKGSRWHSMFNKIAKKHVDFVLCDTDYTFLCAIELNDPSHLRENRIWRDEFVDSAFKSARLPLVWVDANYNYDVHQVAEHIANVVINVNPDYKT